jgi:hypothetical protein
VDIILLGDEMIQNILLNEMLKRIEIVPDKHEYYGQWYATPLIHLTVGEWAFEVSGYGVNPLDDELHFNNFQYMKAIEIAFEFKKAFESSYMTVVQGRKIVTNPIRITTISVDYLDIYMEDARFLLQVGYDPFGLSDIIEIIKKEIKSRRFNNKLSPGFVYLIKSVDGFYKIGMSEKPIKRISHLGVKLPFPIEVKHLIKTNQRYKAEKIFQNRFEDKRVRGEWFSLNEADIDYITSFTELNFPNLKQAE